MLECRDLRKRFGETEVLKGVSLTVKHGEVVGVIGPSGGGKSTFLRCCTLLERIDGGTLRYGDDLTVAAPDGAGRAKYAPERTLKAARRRFGLVFQNFNLFPHFSVMRNITEAPVHVLGRPREEAEATAAELLAKMGLAGKERAYPCELSGGQQQRVSIARALALRPDILFFDEPTSALDPELTGEILKVIRELAAERMTMVIVTHEMLFARDVADRILFLDGGLVAEEGPAKEVISSPKNPRLRDFVRRVAG
ncbi:MAG: amino acid ABC transporter ATP-binding protein [Kiritimatiellae bacterium]|nr:amino acid ABC transporter ATP-binding protein [Kiritimatiellia bacterium]